MKNLKRRFARIHNLMTRQPHDVRFRDEMLELAIQLRSAERFPRRSCLSPLRPIPASRTLLVDSLQTECRENESRPQRAAAGYKNAEPVGFRLRENLTGHGTFKGTDGVYPNTNVRDCSAVSEKFLFERSGSRSYGQANLAAGLKWRPCCHSL